MITRLNVTASVDSNVIIVQVDSGLFVDFGKRRRLFPGMLFVFISRIIYYIYMYIPGRCRRRRKRWYRFYAILFCPARPSTRTRPCYCTYSIGPEIERSFTRAYIELYFAPSIFFKIYTSQKFSNFPDFEHREITD